MTEPECRRCGGKRDVCLAAGWGLHRFPVSVLLCRTCRLTIFGHR